MDNSSLAAPAVESSDDTECWSCHLDRGKRCLVEGNCAAAFAIFCNIVRLRPEVRRSIETEFFAAYQQIANQLISVHDVFQLFEDAMSVFADSPLLHNDMGSLLYRLEHYQEAMGYFRNALDIDQDFLRARENFDGISNLLVERWHFRMLNDIERNKAFECAIERAVQKYGCSTVLDIGCGTGILSMFASRVGADCVFACDLSETMCDIAAKALQANGMSDRVTLYHMMSTDMKIPKHLPERVSLVVTETVDAGLLGEGIVPTVRHAWKQLLHAKGSAVQGRVIPSTATVYGCLIECEHVRRHSRLCCNQIEGIDYSWLHLIGSNHRDSQTDTHSNTGISLEQSEPYTTERMSQLDGKYRHLSETFELLTVDFNEPEVSLPSLSVLNIAVTTPGVVDCVLVWFHLQLIEDVYISSSPDNDLCWEQAIYPNKSLNLLAVSNGDIVTIEVTCSDLCLDLNMHSHGVHQTYGVHCKTVNYFNRREMEILNDTEYQRILCNAVNSVIQQMTPGGDRDGNDDRGEVKTVIDFNRGIPTAGLYAANTGFCQSVLCNIDDGLLPVVETLLESNNLSDSVQVEQLPDCQRRTADVVILDVFDRSGVLCDDILRKTALMLRSPLFDLSVIVPYSVTVCAACISSPVLRVNSQVLGSVPTLGLDIAQFINKYQVKTQVDLDLRRIPHIIITEPLPFSTINFSSCETIRAKKTAAVKVSGHVTAVAFWFDVHLTTDHPITTFSTHKASHWRQAAILLPFDLEVTKGQLVNISFLLRDSCIHFDVEYTDMDKLANTKAT